MDICRKLEEIASNQMIYANNSLKIRYFLQKYRKIILSQ